MPFSSSTPHQPRAEFGKIRISLGCDGDWLQDSSHFFSGPKIHRRDREWFLSVSPSGHLSIYAICYMSDKESLGERIKCVEGGEVVRTIPSPQLCCEDVESGERVVLDCFGIYVKKILPSQILLCNFINIIPLTVQSRAFVNATKNTLSMPSHIKLFSMFSWFFFGISF